MSVLSCDGSMLAFSLPPAVEARAPVVRLLASSAWCDSGVSQVALVGGLLLAGWRKVNLLNEIFLGH